MSSSVIGFYSKRLHTKITKKQRTQRGVHGFCPLSYRKAQAKISNKNHFFPLRDLLLLCVLCEESYRKNALPFFAIAVIVFLLCISYQTGLPGLPIR